jgi:hypothetical protein
MRLCECVANQMSALFQVSQPSQATRFTNPNKIRTLLLPTNLSRVIMFYQSSGEGNSMSTSSMPQSLSRRFAIPRYCAVNRPKNKYRNRMSISPDAQHHRHNNLPIPHLQPARPTMRNDHLIKNHEHLGQKSCAPDQPSKTLSHVQLPTSNFQP